jgi:hypothetical protein
MGDDMPGIDRLDSMQYPFLIAELRKILLDELSASFFGFEVDVIRVQSLLLDDRYIPDGFDPGSFSTGLFRSSRIMTENGRGARAGSRHLRFP